MDNKGPVRVLAIAGHSPRESSSSALLGAVGRLATDTGAEVSIYRELEALPLFSQELDGEHAPAAASDFAQRFNGSSRSKEFASVETCDRAETNLCQRSGRPSD